MHAIFHSARVGAPRTRTARRARLGTAPRCDHGTHAPISTPATAPTARSPRTRRSETTAAAPSTTPIPAAAAASRLPVRKHDNHASAIATCSAASAAIVKLATRSSPHAEHARAGERDDHERQQEARVVDRKPVRQQAPRVQHGHGVRDRGHCPHDTRADRRRGGRASILPSRLLIHSCGLQNAVVLALVLVVSACSDDGTPANEVPTPTQSKCPTTDPPTYDNFGRTFFETYCTKCHDAAKPPGMRGGAPAAINFDTLAGIRMFTMQIDEQAAIGPAATNRFMPGGSGPLPSDDERRRLGELVACEVLR